MRRGGAVAVGLAGAVTACQLVAGISDRTFTVVDAAVLPPSPDAADDVDAGPPDPCAHAGPPARPSGPTDPTEWDFVLAVRTVDVSGTDDAGSPLGYDLDGVCTCDSRPGTAHDGGSVCSPPPIESLCDGDGGVDNAIANLYSRYGAFITAQGTSLYDNKSFECGQQTLVFYIQGYNGQADDDRVRVALLGSFGIRTPHADGERDASACIGSLPDGAAGSPPPYPAKWDGTDTWSYSTASAQPIGGGPAFAPALTTDKAYVSNHRLVVPPAPGATPFTAVIGTNLTVASALTVATLEAAPGRGLDGGLGFRVTDGIIAGRVSAGEMLMTLGMIKQSGTPLCAQPGSIAASLAKSYICSAVDILSDPAQDFSTDPSGRPRACDALSVALRFTAEPARVGGPFDGDGGLDAGCAPGWGTCNDR